MAGRRVASGGGGKGGSNRRSRSAASSSRWSASSEDEPRINDFGVPTGKRRKPEHSDARSGGNGRKSSGASAKGAESGSGRRTRSVASGTPVGDDTTVDPRRKRRRIAVSEPSSGTGQSSRPSRSSDSPKSHSKKAVGFFRRRQSAKPKYGIDEPLTDADWASRPSRSARSASSVNAATKSAPGDFVDARALKNEDLVGETLNQTSSPLGVAARPKVIDFNARLKERRRVSTFKTMTKVLIALVIVAFFGGPWMATLLFAGLFA